MKLQQSRYEQQVSSEQCTTLEYTVCTKRSSELLQLQTSVLLADIPIPDYEQIIRLDMRDYISNKLFGCMREELLTCPVIINVTLLPGYPAGLTLSDNLTTCSCYHVLSDNHKMMSFSL